MVWPEFYLLIIAGSLPDIDAEKSN